MTPKTFSRFRTRNILLWALLFSLFTISLTDCHQKPDQLQTKSFAAEQTDTTKMLNWVILDIRFIANTNAETRDMGIRALESIVMDTILAIRQHYSTFLPVFTVRKGSVTDTLNYQLMVDFPSMTSPLNDSIMASVGPPVCKNPCRDRCSVCLLVLNTSHVGTDPTGPYALIETISSPDMPPYEPK